MIFLHIWNCYHVTKRWWAWCLTSPNVLLLNSTENTTVGQDNYMNKVKSRESGIRRQKGLSCSVLEFYLRGI